MEQAKRTRGGAQPGAGRPRHAPDERKIKFTTTLAPDLHAWLKTQPPGTAEKILRAKQQSA